MLSLLMPSGLVNIYFYYQGNYMHEENNSEEEVNSILLNYTFLNNTNFTCINIKNLSYLSSHTAKD